MKSIDEITKALEDGVKDLFNSEAYRRYLEFMGRFRTYSVNNSILIYLQMPEATLVAGYKAWQKSNRYVRKGETSIKILAPVPHKAKKEIVHVDGTTEEKVIEWNTFRPVGVFDVSQTEGDKVPEICNDLHGSVDGYEELIGKLTAASPVPVVYEDIKGGAKGYYNALEKKIAVKRGMSEEQTVKTLVHEIAHSMLHGNGGEEEEAGRRTKEVQAESVAYTVCNMLGIDTEGYSFGYIAGWSAGKEAKELRESMEIIRKTANKIMGGLR